MIVGVLFFVLAVGTGYGVLRVARLATTPIALGIAPVVGFAFLMTLAAWLALLGLPGEVAASLFLALGSAGIVLGAWQSKGRVLGWTREPETRLAYGVLLLAVVLPLFIIGWSPFVLWGIPNYGHDGAHHVELVQAIRYGVPGNEGQWYPPGFHATVATFLRLVPWVDTAEGTVAVSLGLLLMGQLAVFGLGRTLLGRPLAAAVGTLLLALTLWYPYGPHYVSVWPMAAALILVLGLWAVAWEYLAQPRFRWAAIAALLLGAMVLTHGTEVLTALVGLLVMLAARFRHIGWRPFLRDVALAGVLAALVTAPYLPTLFGWAGTGGVGSFGYDWFDLLRRRAAKNDLVDEVLFWLDATSSGLVVDAPPRAILLAVGAWWVVRERQGRVLIALSLAFMGLVAMFKYDESPLTRQVFAVTLPWGVANRLVMVLTVPMALLAGAGLVALARAFLGVRTRLTRSSARAAVPLRLVVRASVLLTILFSLTLTGFLIRLVSIQTGRSLVYSADDARALGWLRANAPPGSVLANDGAADAGIWAPYKANVTIILPRSKAGLPLVAEQLVAANVAALDRVPEARAAACALNVTYVYRGAAGHPDEPRRFPPLDELRQAPALEEVFSSGEAAVFRVRVPCEA